MVFVVSMEKQEEIIDSKLTAAVIGAAFEVYRTLGHGFSEVVYQQALAKEFLIRSIPFQREAPLKIYYKGELLESTYKADFICFGSIIVELKAVSTLTDAHTGQVYNYLRASHMKIGLIFNFGDTRKCRVKRVVNGMPEYVNKEPFSIN